MSRQASILWWFLFVPYFWVKSFNSRPLFTNDREFANRINGLVVLAVMFTFVVIGGINVTSFRHLLERTVFVLGIYAASCIAAHLLISRKREREYAPLYQTMPRKKRREFGFIVLGLFVLAFVAAILPITNQPRRGEGLSCPEDLTEVSAECS